MIKDTPFHIAEETIHPITHYAGSFLQLHEISNVTLSNSEQFFTILNHINDGVLAVNFQKEILLLNASAKTILEISEKEYLGSHFLHVIRHRGLHEMVINTLKSQTSMQNEMPYLKSDHKILKVSSYPLSSLQDKASIACVLIFQDITEFKKLEQMRTDFVSNVTHELKTPLTSIRGFIETLRDGAIHNETVRDKFLEIVDIEAERLHTLINDIMELSEIETSSHDEEFELFPLIQLIEEIFFILQKPASQKNVKLSMDIPEDIILSCNRNRCKQLFVNLIDNAIKYNEEHGFVSICAEIEKGCFAITVEDSGIGISEEHHQRIFERFYRVDKARSRQSGGTGLGLSIVKHIVNLLQGSIQLISSHEKGSRFILRLPRSSSSS